MGKTPLSRTVRLSISRVLTCCVVGVLAACGGGGGSSGPTPGPDTSAPDTTVAGAPATLTNSNAATFTFTATEAATFEVRLDGAAFAAATSPHALSGLAAGSHTFDVRARDAAGNVDPSPATATWVIDITPPDTQITTAPPAVVGIGSASFAATSADPGATFEASLDGNQFAAAAMPYQLSGVAAGSHTLAIRARDAAGNVDPSPATHQWVYDNLPPETSISGTRPASYTRETTAVIGVFTSEPSTFEASVDGAAYAAVTPPLQLANLSEGTHEVRVRARDVAGNVDPTPASVSWFIDRTSPTGTVLFPTARSYTDASTITFRGTAQDAGGIADVRIGDTIATSTDGFATWSAVVPVVAGTNLLHIYYTDQAANFAENSSTVSVINRGAVLTKVGDLDYDPAGDRLVAIDEETQAVISCRASDGFSTRISGAERAAPGPSGLEGLTVDPAHNRALVIDSTADALVAVDLTTGARTTLSSGSGMGPTRLLSGFGIALDAARNRVFVTVRDTFSVIAVDLATGARSVISGPGVGGGVGFVRPLGIALDVTTGRELYIGDSGHLDNTTGEAVIYQVDIASGSREVFSTSITVGMAQGPSFREPVSLRMDQQRIWLYLLDGAGDGAVQRVLMNGSNRGRREDVVFNGLGGGLGEPLAVSRGLALKDSTNRLHIAQRNGEILSFTLFTPDRSRTALVNSRVGSGLRLENPLSVAIEQLTGNPTSLLTIDPGTQVLVRTSLVTGDRTIVSGAGVGQGAPYVSPRDFVIDTRPSAAGQAALVLDSATGGQGSIVSVALATGERTPLANIGPVHNLRNMRLDAGGNRVLFTDDDLTVANDDALYAVNLTTQARTLISGLARGGGANFSAPTDFVLEPATNPGRVILVDTHPSQLLSVDLATGNRSLFISNDGMPALPLMGVLHLDPGGSRLLGVNLVPQHLFEIPLPVSDAQTRSLISGWLPGSNTMRGTGPLPHFPVGLDVHVAQGIAFVSAANSRALFAIDLVSGDRVMVSH